MTTWAIVVAAGSGRRYGGPKQYEPLGDRRVIDHSLVAARECSDGVVLVVASQFAERPEPMADVVVAGGATRSASTRAGLAEVPQTADVVVVHDGARPLAPREVFESVIAAVVAGAEGAIPVVEIVDTLRTRQGRTVDRGSFVAVQTPQAFSAESLRRAHEGQYDATDDASLVTAIGGRVVHVPGRPENIKITRPVDLVVARALLTWVDPA